MLKLKHITKDYITKQNTINVLKDLTINFRECEFVTVLGQSGCGKTTLLNIIGGLDRYTSGDIIINGKSTKDFDDRDWDKYRNKQIGFVFQSYNLIPHLDVLHNVELALTLAGKKKEVREEKAMDALKKVGLEDQAYKKPNQLSGGQMQRVAIARALVNNPSIILADEPTGALDSESGMMVMELLKEVAKDRLVILVSHNSELANKYSTRTVKLVDGKIVSDTNPFKEEGDDEEDIAEIADDGTVVVKPTIRQKFKKSYKQKIEERKEERKVSMNASTTIGLSAKNLYSKKWRTFLTSFAGSIGIIGIALVIALSTGVSNYIRRTEESALSIYPLQISKDGANVLEFAKMLQMQSDMPYFPEEQKVFIQKVAGNMENLLNGAFYSNDLNSIKKYVDTHLNQNDGYVKYSYSSSINMYRDFKVEKDGVLQPYTKFSPFADSIGKLMAGIPGGDRMEETILKNFGQFLDIFTMVDEMVDNQKLLDSQYDVIGGRWPDLEKEGYDEKDGAGNPTGRKVYECVIQVDKQNQIQDFVLFASGLMHPSEAPTMLFGRPEERAEFYSQFFTIEELLKVDYSILADSDYYTKQVGEGGNVTWASELENGKKTKDSREFIESNSSIKLKVVGVVRAKKNTNAAAIKGVVGYTKNLTNAIVERCMTSEVVDAQRRNCYLEGTKLQMDEHYNIIGGTSNTNPDIVYKDITDIDKVLKDKAGTNYNADTIVGYLKDHMGYAKLDEPEAISIYAASLEGKDNILKMFANYAEDTTANPSGHPIMYTDMFATLMDYIKKLAEAMVSALIAFSSISLIVSSIMISIITYTSVLERRKEIGVLRSIGARKLDISNMFVSESSIIGVISGVLGISFGYIFVVIANAVINTLLKIPKLLSLNWYFALTLIVISFLLSMIAGIIPASIAAKKDPVQALRSE